MQCRRTAINVASALPCVSATSYLHETELVHVSTHVSEKPTTGITLCDQMMDLELY